MKAGASEISRRGRGETVSSTLSTHARPADARSAVAYARRQEYGLPASPITSDSHASGAAIEGNEYPPRLSCPQHGKRR